jgi:hypothetical protein
VEASKAAEVVDRATPREVEAAAAREARSDGHLALTFISGVLLVYVALGIGAWRIVVALL